MLLTNYSIFSAILEQKLYSPSRWFISDGTDYPLKGNKYFKSYKNLLIKIIKENKIDIIYTIDPVNSELIYKYLDKNCFKENKIKDVFNSLETKLLA